MMYPLLAKSYKGAYPFSIGTTSFIYPEHYLPNVRLLAPYLDEIELLMFESAGADALPAGPVIGQLARLGEKYGLRYNVHLPTDVSVSHPDPVRRRRAVQTIIEFIKRVAPLAPTSHTLHVDYSEDAFAESKVNRWRQRVEESLGAILAAGIDGRAIALETLDYPAAMLQPLVDTLDLRWCLDLGHLVKYGRDIKALYERCGSRTAVIHLHGVADGRDHLALNRLAPESIAAVLEILKHFVKTVSLEIFSFQDLKASLAFLATSWQAATPGDLRPLPPDTE